MSSKSNKSDKVISEAPELILNTEPVDIPEEVFPTSQGEGGTDSSNVPSGVGDSGKDGSSGTGDTSE